VDLGALAAGAGASGPSRLAYDAARLKARATDEAAARDLIVDFSRRFVRVP
jgi:hypothetical protein